MSRGPARRRTATAGSPRRWPAGARTRRPPAGWPSAAGPCGWGRRGGGRALRGGRRWRVPLSPDGRTGRPQALLQGRFGRLRDVEVEPDGSLLVLPNNTFRGSPAADDDGLIRLRLE